jgi:hypothetical protein
MAYKELAELLEKLRNADNTSTIMCRVESNGWKQLDRSQGGISARDG